MKRILIFSLLLMAACTNKQEEATTQTSKVQDSIAAPQITVLADLPDSLQPKTVAITAKPVKHIIKNEPKPVDAHGGKANFTTYTTEDGLALDQVYCSFTDSKGNLWFGTNGGGVSRYDGQTFTSFTTAQGLAIPLVNSIAEDKTGNLWFGTYGGGVSRYDGQSFTSFTTAQGLANNRVWSIAEDKTGNLWFGTDGGGVSRYDGQSFTSFTTAQGLANNNVFSIAEDKAGNLWFGTAGGVSRYDGQSFTNFSTTQGLANNHVFSIIEDKKGNLWFGTYGGGVSRYDGETFTSFTTANGLAYNSVRSITEDKMGNLWFGTTGGGVSRYDGQSFTTFTTPHGLAYNSVSSITEDKMGNLWFVTVGGGVSRYEGQSFMSFTTAQGLAYNFIMSIVEDKMGNLWFGTGGGVSRYDGQSFTSFTTAQGLANNNVFSIAEDKTGNLWFGTDVGGVSRYDGETFTSFTTAQGLAGDFVICIVEDKMGNLWFGTGGGGVSRYDGQTFTSFTAEQGLANNIVFSITEDKMGNLWFGTADGLSVMSAADVKQSLISGGVSRAALFKTFTKMDGLPDNNVTQVLDMPDGKMAIGTNLGITLFTTSEDLSTLGNIDIYNSNTGYPVKDVNSGQNCMFLDSKGILWAGTGSEKTALVRFDYSALNKDTLPPTVVLQGIMINEEILSWNSLQTAPKIDSNVTPAYITEEATRFGKELSASERDTLLQKFGKVEFDSISPFYYVPQNLVLPYKDNHITIDFNAIETGRNFMVNYQYILEGYDDEWSPVTKKGTAVYGNMSEGNYTFKVKAQSPEGVWCAPVIYTFKVLPPWYRTWWMYVVYILLFILALRSFIKWRERSLIAEKEQLEVTVKERTAEVEEQKEELVQKNIIVEQEKQKSEDLLLNILPEEIAEELKEKGYSDAKMFDKVTVLFTDFVGFTKVSEQLTPQQLVKELDTCFKAFDGIMGKYGIEKIKTVGDAYLAVCGLPTADKEHAENVVKAAQDIKDFMLNRHKELGDKTFEIRIGVHSGEVVAGIVGVKKFAYDIWGDTVNTAARMEQNSVAGKINISQTTYELVQSKFTCTYRGELEAKNKGKLKMYFVEV